MTLLDPKDYYHVRFVKPADPDTGVVEGYEGIVIEHYECGGQSRAVVEVGPWDECGDPLVIVAVPLGHLERLDRPVDEAQSRDIDRRWKESEAFVIET